MTQTAANKTLIPIGTGDMAIMNTVRNMIRIIRNDKNCKIVKEIASKIQSEHTKDYEQAEAIFDYVYNNVKYVADEKNVLNYFGNEIKNNPKIPSGEYVEFLQAPRRILDPTGKYLKPSEIIKPQGDCDCMTMAVCALALACNLPCFVKIIAWKTNDDGTPNPAYSHVYAEIGIPSLKIITPVDPVIKEFGKEKAPVNRKKIFKV